MRIFKKLLNAIEREKRKEVLMHLRNMNERQLLDCGFSPHLISEGLKAWPWREEEDSESDSINVDALLGDKPRHVVELQNYSDSELADLSLTRGAINDAVKNGRPGIERKLKKDAA